MVSLDNHDNGDNGLLHGPFLIDYTQSKSRGVDTTA